MPALSLGLMRLRNAPVSATHAAQQPALIDYPRRSVVLHRTAQGAGRLQQRGGVELACGSADPNAALGDSKNMGSTHQKGSAADRRCRNTSHAEEAPDTPASDASNVQNCNDVVFASAAMACADLSMGIH